MDEASPSRTIWQRRTEKVSEVIAREIIHDIVSRDLGPGTTLPSESDMLDAYDVGRASLREALRILEVHGLIAIKPGRGGGPVVMNVSSSEFARMATLYLHVGRATYRDLMDARLVIEPMMARLVATRGDGVLREALEASLAGTRTAIDAEDGGRYVATASEFHSLILSVSGNPILDIYGGSLRHLLTERVSKGLFPGEYRERIAAQHEEIANAILAHEPEKAEQLMREHMEQYSAQLGARFPGLLDEIVDWR